MKKQMFILMSILTCLTSVLVVYAATEEWEYDGQYQIIQVLSDGNGGCAFLRMNTNHIQSLTWLDSTGHVVYQSVVSNAVIFTCSKKQLVFSDRLTGEQVKQVDAKGAVSLIADPDGRMEGAITMQYYKNIMADKKGFFAIKVGTSPGSQRLVRFKNK
jgi:hypothetical protein